MNRIAPLTHIPKHRKGTMLLNDLIIDLKKQLLGYEPTNPITMERLDELGKFVNELEDCKERIFFDGNERFKKY